MKMFTTKAVAILMLFSMVTLLAPAQQSALKPQAAQELKLQNLPQGLSEANVRAHVMAPAHTRNIEIEEVNEAREARYKIPLVAKNFKATPKLNVGAFGTTMHTILKANVTGYMLQVRQNGNLIYNLIWDYAQTPADQNKGWNENTRMHVASVSKFLTAVAMVKTLDAKGISYDAKIIDYLPTYWSKGANINKITFRHLLTHKSGFATGSSSSDYAFMKSKVAAGVAGVGSSDYENMNFGLMRILIPIINGNVNKGTTFIADTNLNNQVWDAVTLYHYKNYMQAKVFTPAGVNNVEFAPIPGGKNALAYQFPHNNKHGWNSGNLASVAGGAGWRLSTKELLNVMDAVRRKNTIIPAAKAQYMLDNYFGIDQAINTPAGKLYNKNGSWGTGDGKREQCVAYFLPNGMEVAVFVNSPISASNFSLRGLVKDAFVNSLSD
jgi:CubicO group peptidase (beta-lactamase class C family)